MSELPGAEEPRDELDTQYRRLAMLDRSEPAEQTRRAILTHAGQQAGARRAVAAHVQAPLHRTRARTELRWPATLGALATAVVAAVIIAPRYWPTAPPPAGTAQPHTPAAAVVEGIAAPSAPSPAPASPLPPARSVAEPTQAMSSPRAQAALPPTSAHPAPAAGAANVGAAAARMTAPSAEREERSAFAGAAPANVAPVAGLTARMSADVLRRDQRFWHAAEVGDLSELAALRPQQSDINARDPLGRTALMIAILHDQAGSVSALLGYGADPNATDLVGRTPLAAARESGNAELIATLERYGAR
jgi:Ankyrin repeat